MQQEKVEFPKKDWDFRNSSSIILLAGGEGGWPMQENACTHPETTARPPKCGCLHISRLPLCNICSTCLETTSITKKKCKLQHRTVPELAWGALPGKLKFPEAKCRAEQSQRSNFKRITAGKSTRLLPGKFPHLYLLWVPPLSLSCFATANDFLTLSGLNL